MKQIANFISNNIAIIVLLSAIVALLFPDFFSIIKTNYINILLGLVMFGMGLTLNLADFKVVFMQPRNVIVGCLAQFTIMPLVAFVLTKVFHLDSELAIGVVLVGCCPGGTASNVIAFLAKGDLALSVGMTGVSTLLAPILTPLLTYLLAGSSIDVDILSMFLSILQVVILPIAVGFVVKHYFASLTQRVVPFLPMFSTLIIATIVASIVAANANKLLESGLLIMLVIILHNISGLLLGYLIGLALKMQYAQRVAVSVEVGMQNSGLASSLATIHFATYPMATIPGALFSVWHNISGAIAAAIYRRFCSNDNK